MFYGNEKTAKMIKKKYKAFHTILFYGNVLLIKCLDLIKLAFHTILFYGNKHSNKPSI